MSCLATVVLFLSDPAVASANPPDPYPHDYAVYSVLIAQVHLEQSPGLVVIERQTLEGSVRIDNWLLHFKEKLSPLTDDTMEDFDHKNLKSEALRSLFKIPYRYAIMPKSAELKIFGKGGSGWKAFNKKYPRSKGLMKFSRVGFNKRMDQALVYVLVSGERLGSTGEYYVLTKEGGGWRISAKVLILQS
jgi:hypothetical protein